jgi:bacterioferritin (cytochrome b1)
MLKLPIEAVDRLTARINDEWKAVQFYQSAQIHFADMNYDTIAAFCQAESADEIGHAKVLQDYMADYGVIVQRESPEMNYSFTDPKDFVNQAVELESALDDAYQDDYKALSDYPNVQNLLLQFLTIQTDSVREYLNKQRKLMTLTSEFEFRVLEKEIFS